MTTLALKPLLALALMVPGWAWANEKFEFVSVRLEQNVTDRDGEVVFEATSGDAGLVELKVVAPDGRTVIDFKAPQTKLGIRHLNLESPEPKDLARLQVDFPAGEYIFTGSTVTGAKLTGKATLSHRLPAVATVARPRPDEANVQIIGFEVRWVAGKNLASHVVSIEDERTGIKLIHATLPATATSFVVPDRWLQAGTKYKVSVGAVLPGGNGSFVESSFTTAKK